MVKVLAGLVAAIVIAAAAFFGFEFYVQRQAANEVEAAFAAVRESGAKASHGRVSFDLWSRTITVADIAGESAAQPPISVKIGRFTATGVSQPEAGRFSADRIEATDVDVAGTMPVQAAMRFAYKAPRIEIAKYTGPAGPLRRLDPAAADVHRFVFEHFAAVTAASITAPSVSGSMTMPGAASGSPGLGDYGYSGVSMRDVRDGRIATVTVDRVTFGATMDVAGKQETMTGEVADLAAYDFDAAATLALFDPARAKDDKVYRAYRQMTSGAYTASFATGMTFRIDGMTADDIGIKPSKLQFAQIMAIVEATPPPGTTPTNAQTRDLLEKAAALYEGMFIGGAEVRGLSMDTPDGPVNLAAIRLGKLENGKLAEFALEGLDARSPQGPVKVGRFALKSLDIANLVRMSAQFATTRGDPGPDQLAALLLLLEGTEVRNLVAPYKAGMDPINIDTLNLNWGQFVGPIPTRARATLKMSGPVDPGATGPFSGLAGTGMTNVLLSADLGAAWNEGTRAFALEPVTLEIGNVLTAAARASFANVAREMFSVNLLKAAIMAAQVEAGPLEIALRDNGGVELLVAQQARAQKVSREEARRALVTLVRATAMQLASANPDAMAIAGAVARFIEAPGGTLTVKLTPRGRVAMMGLIDTLRTDPMAALARFQVDASNGR
jgi:hypothetical protein